MTKSCDQEQLLMSILLTSFFIFDNRQARNAYIIIFSFMRIALTFFSLQWTRYSACLAKLISDYKLIKIWFYPMFESINVLKCSMVCCLNHHETLKMKIFSEAHADLRNLYNMTHKVCWSFESRRCSYFESLWRKVISTSS